MEERHWVHSRSRRCRKISYANAVTRKASVPPRRVVAAVRNQRLVDAQFPRFGDSPGSEPLPTYTVLELCLAFDDKHLRAALGHRLRYCSAAEPAAYRDDVVVRQSLSSGGDHLVAIEVQDGGYAPAEHRRHQLDAAFIRQVQVAAGDDRIDEAEHSGDPVIVEALIEAVSRDTPFQQDLMVAVENLHLDGPSVLRVHALAEEIRHVIGAACAENDLPVGDSHLTIFAEEQVVVAEIAVDDGPGWGRKSVFNGDDLRPQPLRDSHCARRETLSKVAREVLPAIVI